MRQATQLVFIRLERAENLFNSHNMRGELGLLVFFSKLPFTWSEYSPVRHFMEHGTNSHMFLAAPFVRQMRAFRKKKNSKRKTSASSRLPKIVIVKKLNEDETFVELLNYKAPPDLRVPRRNLDLRC